MNKFIFLISVLVIATATLSCNTNTGNKATAQTVESSDLTIYYFHFTRRCATCIAVEENARKAVLALYPNEVRTGDYSFASVNLDEPASKALAEKLGVGGQTLLVVHGDKKIDITSAAWMAARDSVKMRSEIKTGVDKVLF